jgi:RimJ/RimL family protein N-acetyltransferase
VKPPIIEYGVFTLRLPATEDVSWVFHACQDEEIQRYTGVPTPYLPEHAVRWVREASARCADGAGLDFVIARTESGELLGAAGIGPLTSPEDGMIGYWVERDARRQGVAVAAVAAIEGWAAEHLGWRRASLQIAKVNVASQRVARACGYEVVGEADPCKGLPSLRFSKSLAKD